MDKKFEEVYERLNNQQRQAVDTIEGPLLVIAGPGTGKTQLLSARVANILKSTDTDPQNILCLTFTNKAAVNMKSRIIQLAGGDGAKVVAGTFHSFAAEIMNLYPERFWNSARLSTAPDAVQLDVVESIVKKLPLDNPLALKFAGQYTLLASIQRGINLAKKSGLTPAKLQSIINFNLAYLDKIEPRMTDMLEGRVSVKTLPRLIEGIDDLSVQHIDEYVFPLTSLSTVIKESLAQAVAQDEGTGKCENTSKWKSRWIQNRNGTRGMFAERDRNRWWMELAVVYEHYRDRLHSRGFYDYDDMIVEVIGQLERNPDMLSDVQERFSYVLIDEFQDSTPGQLRIAQLVADHQTAEGRPNLMAVGDDDQTIYKFNGAELSNMLGFRRNYPTAKTIVLTDNYRSSKTILKTAKKIIEQAEIRLVNTDPKLNKELLAKSPTVAEGEVAAEAYSSRELQFSAVARDIAKRHTTDIEIAVLARSHESLIAMAGILQQHKVPIRYEQAGNILEHELIDQTYLILCLLIAIQKGELDSANALIHKIIRWEAWGIEPEALWRLAVNRGSSWLDSLVISKNPPLKDLGLWFIWLAKAADNQPLGVTLEHIIGLRSEGFASPIKDYLSTKAGGKTNEYFRGLSAIYLLRSLAKEFAAGNQAEIADFVRFIEINRQNEIVVSDESPFITGDHAVQLLTVHKAKGLEFDAVYVIDAVENYWRPMGNKHKPPTNLPLQPPLDDFDDYIRLMYVAATRAKSILKITGYSRDQAGKDTSISTIIQAAMPVRTAVEDDKKILTTVLEENMRWPDLTSGGQKQILKARLSHYNLYATHLLDFLDVSRGGPAYFRERHILRLPELTTASMAYGTAMHSTLELAQKLTNVDAFSLPKMKKHFEKALLAEQQPPEEADRYISQGRATLDRLFEDFCYRLFKGSAAEQIIKDVRLGEARLGGTLDRIDSADGHRTIVDYKTGAPLSSFETRDKSKAVRAYRHRMQLIFYALLLYLRDGDRPGSITGNMTYLEADRLRGLELSYTPTIDDIDNMKKLVASIWSRVINLDFPDTSAYSPDIVGIRAFEKYLVDNPQTNGI